MEEGKGVEEAGQRLALEREHVLADLAAARAELLRSLLGLSGDVLESHPIQGDWSAKDLLVHTAVWDRWCLVQMGRALVGVVPEGAVLEHEDAFNAGAVTAWMGRGLEAVLAELDETRERWMAWLRGLSPETFCETRRGSGVDWSFPNWVRVQRDHERSHAREMSAWKAGAEIPWRPGPACLLAAALRASRSDLLATVRLLRVAGLEGRPLCGLWDLRDVVGHVADWEARFVRALEARARVASPDPYYEGDVAELNKAMVEARRGHAWEKVLGDLREAREGLLTHLGDLEGRELAQQLPISPSNPDRMLYAHYVTFLDHEREHVSGLRAAYGSKSPPD